MKISEQNIIGELAAEDSRTIAVFQTFGIDYSSKGYRSIREVCDSRSIESEILIEDLELAVSSLPAIQRQ